MIGPARSSASDTPPTRADEPVVDRLALNTWIVLRVHASSSSERTLGGLPNDFLSHGAATLLVLDHAVCDEDGLATERAMPWVSSRIFAALSHPSVGLLRPRPYRAEYSTEVLKTLEDAGLLEMGRRIMRRELARIKNGDVSDDEVELPAILRWLNSVMAMAIDLPSTLHYDFHDNHFANLSMTSQEVLNELAPSAEASAAMSRQNRAALVAKALEIAVPDFRLLPPVGGALARRALRHNLRAEKRMMYRYVYGDIPHEEYERFRSRPDFAAQDRIVDSPARFAEAERNIEALLKVRDSTRRERRHAQSLISQLVSGVRSLDNVAGELRAVRETIDDALEREKRVKELRILAGPPALLGALRVLEAYHARDIRPALDGAALLGDATLKLREAVGNRRHVARLGRKHPLAWIAAKYRQAKAQPRRG